MRSYIRYAQLFCQFQQPFYFMAVIGIFYKKRRIYKAVFIMKAGYITGVELMHQLVYNSAVALHLQYQVKLFLLHLLQKKLVRLFCIGWFRKTGITGKMNKVIKIVRKPLYKTGRP